MKGTEVCFLTFGNVRKPCCRTSVVLYFLGLYDGYMVFPGGKAAGA